MDHRKKKMRIVILCASLLAVLLLVLANLALMRPRSAPHRAELILTDAEPTGETVAVPEERDTAGEAVHVEAEEHQNNSRSLWRGTLTISEHRGTGSLSEESFPVSAVLVQTETRSFFELSREDDSALILSFWCELDGDTVRPIIGDHDARFFDIWLTDSDVDLFTMIMSDGQITHQYLYDDGRERCRIDFSIKQENNT